MFIKTNGFKKLLKEAYKSAGLHIGATDNTVYLAGSYWAIEVLRNAMPKEKLAAIIELVGALPESGSQYLVLKYGDQMEIARTDDIYNPLRAIKNRFDAMVPVETTPIIFDISGTTIRIPQNRKDGSITTIGDIFTEIIDDTEVDAEHGHSYAEGPYLETERNGNVYLYNNIMAISIRPIMPKDKAAKLVQYLEKYIINGDPDEEQAHDKSDVSKEEDEKEAEDA